MATFVILAPVIVFALGLVEAFTILPAGGRARRIVATLSILGLMLYVGGYVTGLIGDHLQPGVDSWCWGPISSVGIIMMLIGFVGAVIMLPLDIAAIILGTKKKYTEANKSMDCTSQ